MSQRIKRHHGTCDCCGRRCVIVVHFGYDTQPMRDYRICEWCMSEYGVICNI